LTAQPGRFAVRIPTGHRFGGTLKESEMATRTQVLVADHAVAARRALAALLILGALVLAIRSANGVQTVEPTTIVALW
jgi:hypothetical protein